jgi:hypothetical protein
MRIAQNFNLKEFEKMLKKNVLKKDLKQIKRIFFVFF